ncbi:MAG: hypothetical protein AAGH17_00700 [Pseudomonadota bacterium]
MSIRDAILNATMREMFDLAQHMRKHGSVARAPIPSTGDLIEHIWVWANADPSPEADAAFAEAIGASDEDMAEWSDDLTADEGAGENEDVGAAPEQSGKEVEDTTITAFVPLPLSTDAPTTDNSDDAVTDDADLSDSSSPDEPAEPAPEGRRARRERRALEAARRQAEAVVEAMASDTKTA